MERMVAADWVTDVMDLADKLAEFLCINCALSYLCNTHQEPHPLNPLHPLPHPLLIIRSHPLHPLPNPLLIIRSHPLHPLYT